MIITKTDGCTTGGVIEIDGKPLSEYTEEELEEILNEIINKSEDKNLMYYNLFNAIVENGGEYEDLGQCDQCFDYVYRYELEI